MAGCCVYRYGTPPGLEEKMKMVCRCRHVGRTAVCPPKLGGFVVFPQPRRGGISVAQGKTLGTRRDGISVAQGETLGAAGTVYR